jgi:hypothetical protein
VGYVENPIGGGIAVGKGEPRPTTNVNQHLAQRAIRTR